MKHSKGLITLILTAQTLLVNAENTMMGSTSAQMDGRSIAMGGSIKSVDTQDSQEISMTYFLPFQLVELSTRSLKVSKQASWANLEGKWSQTGDAVFRENRLSLGLAKNLSKTLILQLRSSYYHYLLITGEKGSAILAEMGCEYQLSETMDVGLYVFNPTGSRIYQAENEYPISQSFHLGLSFTPTRKMEATLEFEKMLEQTSTFHLGLEYAIIDLLCLRVGLSGKPLQPSWGIGGRMNRIKFALGASSNATLGYSSCFSIHYLW